MKLGKKIQRKLEERQKGYSQILESLRTKFGKSNPAAYKAPGSRNPKK